MGAVALVSWKTLEPCSSESDAGLAASRAAFLRGDLERAWEL